jgi:hypothetical protein
MFGHATASDFVAEHLDDFVVYDRQWSVLVAIMALCVDWILNRCLLHLPDWPNWCYIPYLVPCCC